MIEYKLSYFKESGKWYSESSIGFNESTPWFEVIEFISRMSKKKILPGLMEGHSKYIVLVSGPEVVPHLILPDREARNEGGLIPLGCE